MDCVCQIFDNGSLNDNGRKAETQSGIYAYVSMTGERERRGGEGPSRD